MLLLHLNPALGFISGVGDANVRCIERERQALLEFKKGLVDDYDILSSWGSQDQKKNCCKWKGVHCSKHTGHVLELDLRGDSEKTQPLRDALSKMNSLESLNFDENQLEGSIPKSFGNICTLSSLSLSNNRLSGQLVKFINILSGCAKNSLEMLDLSLNQITGSLPDFSTFSSLKEIYVGTNNITGTVPKGIGNLHQLEAFDVSNNSMHGVVTEVHLSNLSNLWFLDLSLNSLALQLNKEWVPPFQLRVMYLSSCRLGPRFPSWLQTQWNISILDISDTGISDKIPKWFVELPPTLQYLDVSFNQLEGQLSPFVFPPKMTVLSIAANLFSGTISSVCKITGGVLNFLDLSSNLFNYTDSYAYDEEDVEKYVDDATVVTKGRELEYGKYLGLLKIINLAHNNLTGKLPIEISSLLELVVLNISKNNLIGEIPQMIGQLKQLQSLDMSRNQFSNEIPSSMSELHFLSDLDLSYNNLSGKIPSGTQLQSFDAADFTGNWALCGPPLPNKCPGEETPNRSDQPTDHDGNEDNENDGDEFEKWFFAAAGFGFFIGFWGICGPLLFKSSWRGAYFLFLDNMKDWFYATKLAMCMKRLRWKFKNQG
nr:putative inactive leucine-rich repeat receptor kinase xiao [Quercus suber]